MAEQLSPDPVSPGKCAAFVGSKVFVEQLKVAGVKEIFRFEGIGNVFVGEKLLNDGAVSSSGKIQFLRCSLATVKEFECLIKGTQSRSAGGDQCPINVEENQTNHGQECSKN